MTTAIQIFDEYTTVQGMGHLTGTVQYFVRFSGCGVKTCPIRAVCDEVGALNPQGGEMQNPKEIAERALHAVGRGGWVSITGGEPTDQMDGLRALVSEVIHLDMRVHIQSSGVRAIDVPWDWLTISPKVGLSDLKQRFGQELILLDHGSTQEAALSAIVNGTRFWFYYLMNLNDSDPKPTIDLVQRFSNKEVPWGFTTAAHRYWGVQ
jgi:organic radical activating enzyme